MSESPPAVAGERSQSRAGTEASTLTGAPSAAAHPDGDRPVESLPTGELVRRASEQLSTLVRDELALARAEMVDKAGHVGKSAGLFGGAGVVSLYGVFGLLTGCVLLLARVMPDWGAALVIGALLLAIAGLMAITGRSQVKQVGAPLPEAAVDRARRDLGAVASAVESRKNR